MMKRTGLFACVLMSGCAMSAWDAATRQALKQQEVLDGRRDRFRAALSDERLHQKAQMVDAPWVAGRAQRLDREVSLPLALRADVDTTLLFSGPDVGLSVVARRIQRATGISVRVMPDALLPSQYFLPRLAGLDDAVLDTPTQVSLRAGPAPLPNILDDISARLGVYWRYRSDHIEFFRTDTRVFRVRALTVSARTDAQLGRSARSGSGGFENTSNTTLTTGDQDTLESIRARIEPFMTRAGVLAAEPGGAGSIVVTDTLDVLDRIDAFLAQENKVLTRRVRLLFEEVSISTADLQSRAINWDAVYQAGKQTIKWGATGIVPDAMSLGGAVAGGALAGTSGMAAALSRYATVLRHTEVPLLTLNRRPVTHAVRTTFSYVNQVQRSSGDTSDGRVSEPITTVSQKEETVGVFLTVLPDVQDDGRVLMSVAYDNTVAQPLVVLEVGAADNGLRVQQVTVDGSGMVQQVELRAGLPALIAGFDRVDQSAQTQRLAPGLSMLLGGKDRVEDTHVTTLIFVTVQIDETEE